MLISKCRDELILSNLLDAPGSRDLSSKILLLTVFRVNRLPRVQIQYLYYSTPQTGQDLLPIPAHNLKTQKLQCVRSSVTLMPRSYARQDLCVQIQIQHAYIVALSAFHNCPASVILEHISQSLQYATSMRQKLPVRRLYPCGGDVCAE